MGPAVEAAGIRVCVAIPGFNEGSNPGPSAHSYLHKCFSRSESPRPRPRGPLSWLRNITTLQTLPTPGPYQSYPFYPKFSPPTVTYPPL
ncbi:hypothetical protein Lbir_2853 [Legionella birminghamensis]|uniref:Uncharacterized protein n=1 Tax=Legionella birminghamensis TaxID=28083 RepID=A0A378I750_9GAMM|nr:hypothetical protein Lbir_2853 [Legionella birminghamensis]STX31038.1 Uncharacterised protein [Legionella birminghamensis]